MMHFVKASQSARESAYPVHIFEEVFLYTCTCAIGRFFTWTSRHILLYSELMEQLRFAQVLVSETSINIIVGMRLHSGGGFICRPLWFV